MLSPAAKHRQTPWTACFPIFRLVPCKLDLPTFVIGPSQAEVAL